MILKDVMDTAHAFMANVQITEGRVHGVTCLPLPYEDEECDEEQVLDFNDSVRLADPADIMYTREPVAGERAPVTLECPVQTRSAFTSWRER
jgi:hypothetical protein